MQQVCIDAFTFEELSGKAKEEARDWWRIYGLHDEWWDALYEDFVRVAKILGVEIDPRNQQCRNSATGRIWVDTSPAIYFSGFASQGDGACFEGYYSYGKMAHKKIREYAPKDEDLHSIADALLEIQKANGYLVTASIKHRGHYYHSGCMQVDVYQDDQYADAETEAEVTRLLRRLADWMYHQLGCEYWYMTSDEQVDEAIIANDYLFSSEGSRTVVL